MRERIDEACRMLALGTPDTYLRSLYTGISLCWLPLIPLLMDKFIRIPALQRMFALFPLLRVALGLTLALIPLQLILKGLRPVLRYREHLAALEHETPFAVLAISMLVAAGIPPLIAFEALASLEDALPHTAQEVLRIKRDAMLALRHLSEQLAIEAARAKGKWARLLDALVAIERSGWEPRIYMRDLVNLVINDLRVDYMRLSEHFRTLVSSASVLFGAFPMMITVLFTILASTMVIPMVVAFSILAILLASMYIFFVDVQVPRTISYWPVYRRILMRWLPMGVAVALLVYLGVIQLPVSLVIPHSLAIGLGLVAFSVPGFLEFRLHAQIIDEIIDKLPSLLRDLASEIHRGAPPHIGLERVSETHTYGPWMDRLVSLIVRRLRITGSLKEAIAGIERLLPEPVKVSFSLIVLSEEYGAGAESYHILADIMSEYMLMIREFKRGNTGYRWLSIGMALLTFGMVLLLFNTVVGKIAMAGELMKQAPVPLPVMLVTPEQLPMLKDWICTMVIVNGAVLGMVTGKTLDWRIGGGLRDVAIISGSFVTLLVLSTIFGLL